MQIMEKQPQAKSSQVQLYVRSAKRPKQPDCGKSSHDKKIAKLRESSPVAKFSCMQEVQIGQSSQIVEKVATIKKQPSYEEQPQFKKQPRNKKVATF